MQRLTRALVGGLLASGCLLLVAGCSVGALTSMSWLGGAFVSLALLVSACSASHGREAGSGGAQAGSGAAGGVGGSAGTAGVGGTGGTGGVSGIGGTGGVSGIGGTGGVGGETCSTVIDCGEDHVPYEIEICCPNDPIVACNYWSATVCADGSCAAPWETCPEECLGTIEDACVNGEIVPACCPEGTDCNYGAFLVCGDGSCANSGYEECADYPCDEPGGQLITACHEGSLASEWRCPCPPDTICNYFDPPFEVCADGSCAVLPLTCLE